MERDGDARAPRELGDGEIALLKAELGAVEGLQVGGGEVGAAPDPRLLEAPHHMVPYGRARRTGSFGRVWMGVEAEYDRRQQPPAPGRKESSFL